MGQLKFTTSFRNAELLMHLSLKTSSSYQTRRFDLKTAAGKRRSSPTDALTYRALHNLFKSLTSMTITEQIFI